MDLRVNTVAPDANPPLEPVRRLPAHLRAVDYRSARMENVVRRQDPLARDRRAESAAHDITTAARLQNTVGLDARAPLEHALEALRLRL